MNVHVSDRIYVLGVGPGTVVKINPDTKGFVVSVPGKGEYSFGSNGCVGVSNVRKAYYQNPIFIDPPRDGRLWTVYLKMATDLFNLLKELDRTGDLPDPEQGEPQ